MANYPYMNYTQPYGGYNSAQGYMNYMQSPATQAMSQQPQGTVTPSAPVQMVQQPVSQPGFVCRPVASKAEAQAVPTDFSGNMLVMTDIANGAIYTKALDPTTGSAQFVTYLRAADQESGAVHTVVEVQYASLEDVNKAVSAVEEKIDALRSDFESTVYEEIKRVVPKKGTGKAAE